MHCYRQKSGPVAAALNMCLFKAVSRAKAHSDGVPGDHVPFNTAPGPMPSRPGSCAAFVCLPVYLSVLYVVPGPAADDTSSLAPVLLFSGNASAGGCLTCPTHVEQQCHRSRKLGRSSSPFAPDFIHLCTHVKGEASISAAASRCCAALDCHGQQAVVRDSVANAGDTFATQLQDNEFSLHHHLYPSVARRRLREARHCNIRAAS